jgi:hypothetical protein
MTSKQLFSLLTCCSFGEELLLELPRSQCTFAIKESDLSQARFPLCYHTKIPYLQEQEYNIVVCLGLGRVMGLGNLESPTKFDLETKILSSKIPAPQGMCHSVF